MYHWKSLVVLLLFVSRCLAADNAAVTKPEPSKTPPAPANPVAVVSEKLNPGNPQGGGTYDGKTLWGEPVFDQAKKLDYVAENPLQTHERKNCVFINVSGYKERAQKSGLSGRLRVAVWDREDIYGKEGIKPFRASSHWVKDAPEKMRFKICGLEKNRSYSFFAHYDETNAGKVRRNWIGIPQDLYGFTNVNDRTKLIERVGIGAPPFARTLYLIKAENEEITMVFN